MANFFTRTVMGKLVLYFVPVAILGILAISYVSYLSTQNVLEHGTSEQLKNLRDIAAERVRENIKEVTHNLTFMSRILRVRNFFEAVSSFQDSGVKASEFLDSVSVKDYVSPMDAIFGTWLETNGTEEGYEDFLAIDASEGFILNTSKKLVDSGTNLRTGPLKDSSLAKVWETVVKTQKPAMVDFTMYQRTKKPSAFLAAPVFALTSNRFVGVLVVRINANHLNQIIKSVQSAGMTLEAYVVGEDMAMRTDSRFQADSTVLVKKVDTEPVRLAIQGKKGDIFTTDYTGEAAFSAYGNVDLDEVKGLNTGFKWYIITSISASEALQPARAVGQKATLITLCIAGVIGVIALLLARTFTKPLTSLAAQVSQASHGDLTVKLQKLNRKDEIGVLEDAVRSMLKGLNDQTRQISEVVSILSSSAAEISATVAQLATSTSKTSAAVTETTTTVEQVKQAAQVSSEKAKKVSASAQQAVQVSEAGKRATADTVHRMSLIKEQMESIGETVIRLSEHSQAIEDIINAVQDIADQSNLLAVNASIEAARAGDQGKGFAVVANEIKSLADQSKSATERVKSILDDTQKWVNAVVMAAEQGGKAVDSGVAQSLVAGDSIQSLANSVAASSQAASVIDTTSEQQFVGVDQVASAMTNIEQAMRQNLDGTTQLASAAQELQELGDFLKGLVQRYKI